MAARQFHGIQLGDVKDTRLAARRSKPGWKKPSDRDGGALLVADEDERPAGKGGCCCVVS